MTMYHCHLLEHENRDMMHLLLYYHRIFWIWWNIWAIVIIYICIWRTCRI